MTELQLKPNAPWRNSDYPPPYRLTRIRAIFVKTPRGRMYHRPRSAVYYPPRSIVGDRICVESWCGMTLHNPMFFDKIDVGVCPTCEARAASRGLGCTIPDLAPGLHKYAAEGTRGPV